MTCSSSVRRHGSAVAAPVACSLFPNPLKESAPMRFLTTILTARTDRAADPARYFGVTLRLA
jgi:hypothetical protein